MKTSIPRPLLTLVFAAIAATSLRADAATLAQIIHQRDQVLSQILAAREAHLATGTVDEESVFSARLALLTFRRDVAPTRTEKIAQQQLIVAAYEKRLGTAQARTASGVGTKEDLLLAQDRLLEAQQTLETLHLDSK